MRHSSSKYPNMGTILKILREDPTFPIAELARKYNTPDGRIRGSWRTEKLRIEEEKRLAETLAKVDNNAGGFARVKPHFLSDGGGGSTRKDGHIGNNCNPSPSIVLVIPDTHSPWEHPDSLEFLKAVKARYKPNVVVHLGDEVDFYGMSRFDHDPDVISPGSELSLAVKHLIPFYREFPNVLVCQSNHTHRVHAKAKKSGMPSSTIRSIEEILKSPEGWIYKRAHKIDGVVYKHGTGKSGPQAHINHAKAISQSCVIGHIHAYAAVNYIKPGMFAANFGCLIDKTAECFAYAEEMDDNIVLGCGLVMGGKEAHFLPMHLNEDGRWTGKLHG